jgi:hypothetical protein
LHLDLHLWLAVAVEAVAGNTAEKVLEEVCHIGTRGRKARRWVGSVEFDTRDTGERKSTWTEAASAEGDGGKRGETLLRQASAPVNNRKKPEIRIWGERKLRDGRVCYSTIPHHNQYKRKSLASNTTLLEPHDK